MRGEQGRRWGGKEGSALQAQEWEPPTQKQLVSVLLPSEHPHTHPL